MRKTRLLLLGLALVLLPACDAGTITAPDQDADDGTWVGSGGQRAPVVGDPLQTGTWVGSGG